MRSGAHVESKGLPPEFRKVLLRSSAEKQTLNAVTNLRLSIRGIVEGASQYNYIYFN